METSNTTSKDSNYLNYFNELNLSTITVESKISNIKFKECELISKLSLSEKTPEILKIGCNYGEYISDKYIELTTSVKKSNRGRKKKINQYQIVKFKEMEDILIVKLHLLF